MLPRSRSWFRGWAQEREENGGRKGEGDKGREKMKGRGEKGIRMRKSFKSRRLMSSIHRNTAR